MLSWLGIPFLLLSATLVVDGQKKDNSCKLVERTASFNVYDCAYSVIVCSIQKGLNNLAPNGAYHPNVMVESNCTQRAGRVPEVTQQELQAYLPFAVFAAACYCPPQYIACGTCDPIFKRRASFNATLVVGSDGTKPMYFVGYSPEDDAVVVSFRGTDPLNPWSVATNLAFIRESLDASHFPAPPENASIHSGYAAYHSIAAEPVRMEVEKLLKMHETNKLFITGHSKGGAIAMLNALYLTLHLSSDVQIQTVTFGAPRIGNAAFVEYFDSKVRNFTRIVYGKDVVPNLPPKLIGYLHAKGEVRVLTNGTAVRCPGNDFDADTRCYAGDTMNLSDEFIWDHFGPFPGNILMRTGIYEEMATERKCPPWP